MLVSNSSHANLRYNAASVNLPARSSTGQAGPFDRFEMRATEPSDSWADRNPRAATAAFGGAFGGAVGAFFGTFFWACGASASAIPTTMGVTGLLGAAYFGLQD